MKKFYHVILVLVTISSCSIQKRLYQKGVHIETLTHKNVKLPILHSLHLCKNNNNKHVIYPHNDRKCEEISTSKRKNKKKINEVLPPLFNEHSFNTNQILTEIISCDKKINLNQSSINVFYSNKAKHQYPDTLTPSNKTITQNIIFNITLSSINFLLTTIVYYYYYFYTLTWFPLWVSFLLGPLLFLVALIHLIFVIIKLNQHKNNDTWKKYFWIMLIIDMLTLFFLALPIVFLSIKL